MSYLKAELHRVRDEHVKAEMNPRFAVEMAREVL